MNVIFPLKGERRRKREREREWERPLGERPWGRDGGVRNGAGSLLKFALSSSQLQSVSGSSSNVRIYVFMDFCLRIYHPDNLRRAANPGG